MAIKPNSKGVVTGTKKSEKITWNSPKSKLWKKKITVNAGAGNDNINFSNSSYANKLNGGNGKDTIKGGKKNDVITGGKSNDTIYTGKGSNTLIINKGDGNDTIYIQGTKTTIKFNKPNAKDKVTAFEKKGNDLILTYTHAKLKKEKKAVVEKITLKNYYKADGTIANNNIYIYNKKNQRVSSLIKNLKITGVNNEFRGTYNADTINGTTDNDKIYGKRGNDVINAGKGNNTIYFNKNEDTNIIQNGGGTDTLIFSDETDFGDLTFSYNENDLNIGATGTTVVLKDYKSGNHSAKYVKAGSQTINLQTALISNNSHINATTGNDVIIGNYSGTGPQQIYGQGGNDIVYCSDYCDTSLTLGDGDDTIYCGDYDGSNYSVISVGNGNNTIYYSNNYTNTSLGEGNDSLYLTGVQNIYINSSSVINGGHDTIYLNMAQDENNGGYLRFENTPYDDLIFTQENNSNDLTIRYGVDNSVTFKDYYKAGNEKYAYTGMYCKEGTPTYHSVNQAVTDKGIKTVIYSNQGTNNDDYIIATDDSEEINALNGNDVVNPKGGNDEIHLNSGNNIVLAGAGNKTVYAGEDDNQINLGNGNNTVYTNMGSDTVNSGTGNNTIYFYAEDGNDDTYKYGGGNDTFVFEDEMELTVDNTGNDLTIIKSYLDESKITLLNTTIDNENIHISINGDTISLINMNTKTGHSDSTAIQTITTGSGNDTIYSGLKNDTITAGAGENTVYLQIAESGNNNTYNYTTDTNVQFIINGLTNLDGLRFLQNGNDLLIGYNNGDYANNTLTITDYYSSAKNIMITPKNESTYYTSSNLTNLMTEDKITNTITCSEGNHTINGSSQTKGVNIVGCSAADSIIGSSYADIINGKGGADTLKGGESSDVYIIESSAWSAAGQQKTIIDTSGDSDSLKISTTNGSTNFFFNVELTEDGDEVVLKDNLPTYTTGNDLYITAGSITSVDSITSSGVKIENYFTTGKIENMYREEDSTLYTVYENQVITTVGQGIANWLNKNHFDSTQYVLENGTEEDKSALLNLYSPAITSDKVYHSNTTDSDDIIIGIYAGGKQTIYGHGGNDIVYCSGPATVNLLDGDDIVYCGYYEGNADYSSIYTGNGNNTIYYADKLATTYLGEGNDTLYLKGMQEIYINSDSVINGGHDTLYINMASEQYSGGKLRFNNSTYNDLQFTREGYSNDLVVTYGENNSVTLKDYYKAGNERYAYTEIYLADYYTRYYFNKSIIDKGGAGNDIYNSISVSSSKPVVINDNGGNDIINLSNNVSSLSFIFNVKKDGTFAEGKDKLLVTYNNRINWNNFETPVNNEALTINDFDSIERINTSDGYYIDTTKLNDLKTDVVNWLNSANGGNGYDDVVTALASNDADLNTLKAYFTRQTNWQSAT